MEDGTIRNEKITKDMITGYEKTTPGQQMITVTYKDDNNVVRSKMSTFIDSRSAVDVARGVKADCDKKNDQTSEAYKHATSVLQAAGITD